MSADPKFNEAVELAQANYPRITLTPEEDARVQAHIEKVLSLPDPYGAPQPTHLTARERAAVILTFCDYGLRDLLIKKFGRAYAARAWLREPIDPLELIQEIP